MVCLAIFGVRCECNAVAFGFIENIWSRGLFAESVKPTIEKWLKGLSTMTEDLRGRKLTDLEFQKKMEELYAKVNLEALVGLVKLDEIEKTKKLPDSGALIPATSWPTE